MSPTEQIIEEVNSLEEETNKALDTLTETVNLNAAVVEDLANRIETIDQRVGSLEDFRDYTTDLEKVIGELTRRIKALESPEQTPPFVPDSGKRLFELEKQARTLGSNWAEVEIFQRPDGMLVVNNFIGTMEGIERHIQERDAKNKGNKPEPKPEPKPSAVC